MLTNPFRRITSPRSSLVILLIASVLLSACGASQGTTPPVDEQPQDTEDISSVVSATGVVVPEQYASLSMAASGVVAEILVAEGDSVEAGQPLLRLAGGDPHSPSPELLAAIRARELEVDAAQKALDTLNEQARQGKQLAEQQLNSAAGQVRDLQYRLLDLELPESQQDLSPIEGYDAALEAYQAAEDAFEPYKDEPAYDSDRAEREDDLDEAKEDYDTAVLRLQLSLSLEAAEASRDQARQDWEKFQDGPTEEDEQDAEKRLGSARAGLEAARAALTHLTLEAPFAGTVAEVNPRPGEWVSPGAPVVTLGNLEDLIIQTTDLNEIDMIRIAVGDPVKLSFDALGETVVNGKVLSIARKAAPGTGVNYTVVIRMDAPPEGLRWGMSAFVDILLQE